MATWLVHLRIADYFMKTINWLDESEFTVGSVAPDCGYGQKDSFGEFTPPPTITHWTPTGRKNDCRYKDFFNKYLRLPSDSSDYSFYLGYYVHLLTDVMWSKMIYLPTHITYAKEYERNPEFLKVIKVDWYDLDHKFLRDNPDFEPFELLAKKNRIKDYLPYYEKNQLTIQVHSIVKYYRESFGKAGLDREYTYLTEQQMDNFIVCACELIKMELIRRHIIDYNKKKEYSA